MTRRFLVAGNWKLNGSKQLITDMATLLNGQDWSQSTDVVICPPAPYLERSRSEFKKNVFIGAQNVYNASTGAYTGELSVEFFKDIHIDYAIIGHSERREIFKESDQFIAEKAAFAARAGIKVMFCCGEKLEEREKNDSFNVVKRQISALANIIQPEEWKNVIIAYEPVWAIGTGKVATPQQAQEMHELIRQWLSQNVSSEVAESTLILYGGSVNAANCGTLQGQKDIDGFLVGGASLKPNDFLTIIKSRL